MNTKPTVSRFADRAKITVQPNTLAKVAEEGDTFKFTIISRGHYACDSGKNTHAIIEKDGKIGCSCGDMTYRCTGTNVCKHIAKFVDLEVPPQIPASEELIRKLTLMGWVGGRDNLHPAELLKPAQNETQNPVPLELALVVCPHCTTRAKRKTQEEADAWLDNHLAKCPKNPDNKKPKEHPEQATTAPETGTPETPSPASDPLHEPEDPQYPDPVTPDLPDPPSEDYSNCSNVGAVAPLVPGIYESTEPDEPLLSNKLQNAVPSNLASALCNMQKIDLLAVTDSDNPFHNSKYADLASVWAAIRKPLTDNGLAVIQTTEQYQDGITVVTTLIHTSGESFTARLSCEVPKSKPDKNGFVKPNIQGLGSTITYLRRYSLVAMVGVAPVDDDGEAAMGR